MKFYITVTTTFPIIIKILGRPLSFGINISHYSNHHMTTTPPSSAAFIFTEMSNWTTLETTLMNQTKICSTLLTLSLGFIKLILRLSISLIISLISSTFLMDYCDACNCYS